MVAQDHQQLSNDTVKNGCFLIPKRPSASASLDDHFWPVSTVLVLSSQKTEFGPGRVKKREPIGLAKNALRPQYMPRGSPSLTP